MKTCVLLTAGIVLATALLTCNIFNGEPYTERNTNGYRPVELVSPQKGGELNRLAFGVSSRVIHLGMPDSNFRPWGVL